MTNNGINKNDKYIMARMREFYMTGGTFGYWFEKTGEFMCHNYDYDAQRYLWCRMVSEIDLGKRLNNLAILCGTFASELRRTTELGVSEKQIGWAFNLNEEEVKVLAKLIGA